MAIGFFSIFSVVYIKHCRTINPLVFSHLLSLIFFPLSEQSYFLLWKNLIKHWNKIILWYGWKRGRKCICLIWLCNLKAIQKKSNLLPKRLLFLFYYLSLTCQVTFLMAIEKKECFSAKPRNVLPHRSHHPCHSQPSSTLPWSHSWPHWVTSAWGASAGDISGLRHSHGALPLWGPQKSQKFLREHPLKDWGLWKTYAWKVCFYFSCVSVKMENF